MAIHRIYVDLDSMFDTRLPLLYRLDPEHVVNADVKAYFQRRSDDFSRLGSKVTRQEWLKAWEKRDKSLLAEAVTTSVVTVLWEAVMNINWALDSDMGSIKKVDVEINTWPYDLTNEEMSAIRAGLEVMMPPYASVLFIHNPMDFLHPKDATGRWDMMFVYDLWGWLRRFKDDFEQVYMIRTTVVTPELVSIYADEMKDEDVKLVDELHGFRVIEASFQGRMQLRCMPVEEFCLKPRPA